MKQLFHILIIIFYLPGIAEKDQLMIFQIQAAVLHFGNVKIHEADGESSQIKVSHMITIRFKGEVKGQCRTWFELNQHLPRLAFVPSMKSYWLHYVMN